MMVSSSRTSQSMTKQLKKVSPGVNFNYRRRIELSLRETNIE